MAVRESRRTRHDDDEDVRDAWSETDDSDQRASDDDDSTPNRQMVRAPQRRSPARNRVAHGEVFNPRRAIPIGLLRLARTWSDTGAVYQAIHAYTEVLIRYPQTGASEAAAEELLILADRLAQQGRYYAALNIFNKLELLC
jgi:tetratricopeptide (TPR) repeat protein